MLTEFIESRLAGKGPLLKWGVKRESNVNHLEIKRFGKLTSEIMKAFPATFSEGCSCIQLTQVTVFIVLQSVRFDQTLKSVNQMEQPSSRVKIVTL